MERNEPLDSLQAAGPTLVHFGRPTGMLAVRVTWFLNQNEPEIEGNFEQINLQK